MDTLSINKVVLGDAHAKKYYGGTLASDRLPTEIKNFPVCFIVNTSPHYHSGEHWISLYLEKHGSIEVFCSFGSGPFILSISPHIRTFLKKFGYSCITYNDNILQNIASSYCGLYAITYLKIKCRKYSFENFISCFSDNTLENDAIIESIKDIILDTEQINNYGEYNTTKEHIFGFKTNAGC